MAPPSGPGLESSTPRLFSPRPPSAAHPDDFLATIQEAEVSESRPNIFRRMGGKVGKQIRKKHACERAFMCALAVSLLWLTSLVVAKEVTHLFIPVPTMQSVDDSVTLMTDNTKAQRTAYQDCATRVAEVCEADFNADTTAESSRLAAVQSAIEEHIASIKSEVVYCSQAYLNATNIFNAYSNSNSYVSSTGAICSQYSFSEFLSSETNTANAVQDLESYKGASDAQVEDLNNQIGARAAYDLEFMNNKTNGLFAEVGASLMENLTSSDEFYAAVETEYASFMACVSPTSSYVKSDGTTAVCGSSTIFYKANQQMDQMQNTYESLLDEARAYRTEIEAKMTRYEELRKRVENIYHTLVESGFPGSWVYLSGLSLGFSEHLSSLLGSQFDSLTNLVEGPAEIYADMQTKSALFLASVTGEGGSVDSSNSQFEGNVTALMMEIFDDYNPPYVNETLLEEQQRASSSVVGEVTHELSSVTSEENGTSSVEEFVDSSAVNISQASAQLLDKADPRTWADYYSYPEDVFAQFVAGMVSVNDLALAFDYAYRVIHSLMLIRKYWNISAINTPPADVRTKKGIAAGTFVAQQNPAQKVASILTNPIFNIFLVLLFLGLFGAAFYGTYSPIYNEYTNNCVDKCYQEIQNTIVDVNGEKRYNTTANGTMLYRNAFALAQQYAFSDGDHIANTQVDSLGVTMELSCRDETVDSISIRLNQDDRYDYYTTRAIDLTPKYEYIRECIDTAGIESATSYTFADVIKQDLDLCVKTYETLEEYLTTLNLQVTSLQRIYNCDSIGACNFDCSGPNEAVLRGVTFETSCTSEWYAHAQLLTFFCALFGFITINLARVIFLNGIVKVMWRHLSSHKFAMIASCREDGAIIYPEEVTEEGESFRKVIIKQLRVAIREFERRGCLITLFGVSLIFPWFAILFTLSEHLAFDSDKICEL